MDKERAIQERVKLEMWMDQIAVLRMAVAWLMARDDPNAALDWVERMRLATHDHKNLEEMSEQFALLAEELAERCAQRASPPIPQK